MLINKAPFAEADVVHADCQPNGVHVDELQLVWPDTLLVFRIKESLLKVLVLPDVKVRDAVIVEHGSADRI